MPHHASRDRARFITTALHGALAFLMCLLAGWPALAQEEPAGTSPEQIEQKSAREAVVSMHRQLSQAADSSDILVRLGQLYLKLASPDSARWALEQAVRQDSTDARAQAALGILHLDFFSAPRVALTHLQAAIRLDSTRAKTYFDAARAHLAVKEERAARKAADTAIRRDAAFAPPYHLLARLYEKEGNETAARVYYRRYLDQNPEDQTAAFEFAVDLIKKKRFAEAEELASRMADYRSLPLLAQALMERRDHDGAVAAFAEYTGHLPPKEQELYDDISLVAQPHEARAYQSTTPETRAAYLRDFWLRKDPFKTTGGAMRKAEHYRRVWHARSFFSKREWPWDKRGDVYIRYGEPDYRSSSREVKAQVPLKVQRVQELMAHQLYGNEAISLNFVGPVYPIRNTRSVGETSRYSDQKLSKSFTESFDESNVGLEFYKPITASSDFSAHPWEVWIYTDVDGGLEIAFTDEYYSGRYGFAPVPTLSSQDIDRYKAAGDSPMGRIVRNLNQFSPAARLSRIARTEPERYDLSYLDPLDFYYEALAFRSIDGSTELQVNIGLPIDNVAMPSDPDTAVVVERRVVLYSSRSPDLQRDNQKLAIPIADANRGQGLLAVDRVDLRADPGDYELAVEAGRTNTDKLQVYRQTVTLPDYSSGRVMLSDIQIARNVTEASETGRTRFARGNWDILPAPSRSFPEGDPLFVYFEIYNLNRDTFGNTRYEVAYEVRSRALTSKGGRAAALLSRIRRRNGESIEVRYEQVGTETRVADFVELDLGEIQPGTYVVRMDVKDLNSELTASREGVFHISKRKTAQGGRRR